MAVAVPFIAQMVVTYVVTKVATTVAEDLGVDPKIAAIAGTVAGIYAGGLANDAVSASQAANTEAVTTAEEFSTAADATQAAPGIASETAAVNINTGPNISAGGDVMSAPMETGNPADIASYDSYALPDAAEVTAGEFTAPQDAVIDNAVVDNANPNQAVTENRLLSNGNQAVAEKNGVIPNTNAEIIDAPDVQKSWYEKMSDSEHFGEIGGGALSGAMSAYGAYNGASQQADASRYATDRANEIASDRRARNRRFMANGRSVRMLSAPAYKVN